VSLSPNGRNIATGSEDETVRVWDLQTLGCVRALRSHEGIVSSVCFSHDGELLASSSWDQSIEVWNTKASRVARTLVGHTDTVSCIDFNPASKHLVSASWDKTIKVWDLTGLAGGSSRHSYATSHTGGL